MISTYSRSAPALAGWRVRAVPPAHFDWPSLIAAKDNEIGRLSQIYINMLNNSGVEIIDGRGIVCDAHTVEVAGQTYTEIGRAHV